MILFYLFNEIASVESNDQEILEICINIVNIETAACVDLLSKKPCVITFRFECLSSTQ